MLKYEHVNFDGNGDNRMEYDGDGAYRMTVTYQHYDLPDVRYYYDGVWHRTDGPAFIDLGGYISFWVNGKRYLLTEQFCEDAGMSGEETFMWMLKFGDRLPETAAEFYGEGWKDMSIEKF